MATVQQPPKSPAKHEAFVEQQLYRALGRIRLFDLTAGALGLVIGTGAYALSMILLDRYFDLAPLTRQLALAGYSIAAVAYVGLFLVRPLLRTVNPYYAARQVEQTLPSAKNSVVNWLDLRHEKLPAAIRNAVGVRAAKDIGQVNLDQAISGRQVVWMGGFTLGILIAMIAVLAILGPTQFFSLFGRAFKPFVEGSIATRTRLSIAQPAAGDAMVPVNHPVTFVVRVEGRVPDPNKPDALRLLFRYNADEPVWLERRLERGDSDQEWTYRLAAFEVQNGFWYKIAGGDFETAEHHVAVRSSPLVTGFDVRYKYRPYLVKRDQVSKDPNIEAMRGTEVTVLAHTNRTLQSGELKIEGDAKPVKATILKAMPETLEFKFVVDRDTTYRLRFTSLEDEVSGDSVPYTIKAIADRAPKVELAVPGKDVQLPTNGTLSLEGAATDDYGLTNLTLRLRVKGGVDLQPKVYRADEGKSFRFDDGSYPLTMEYKDFIELDKLKDTEGRPWPVRPGMEIEYWLEASDNCDYPPPGPNVGQSKTYLIKLLEPEKDPKKADEQRNDAKQKKEEHKKKQDQDHDKKNEQKKEDAKNQNNQNNGNQNNPNNDPNGQKPPPSPEDKKFENERENLANQLKNEQNKGDAKEEPKDNKGEGKNQGPNQGAQGAGDNKQGPKPDEGKNPGEGKSPSNPGEKTTPNSEKGESKPEPKAGGNDGGQGGEQGQQGQGEAKPDPKQGGQGAAEGKDGGKDGAKNAGGTKGDGGKGTDTAGETKGTPGAEENDAKAGNPKGPGTPSNSQSNQTATGAVKDDPSNNAKGESKPGEVGGSSKTPPQGTAKAGPNDKGEPGAQPKPGPDDKGQSGGNAKGDKPPKDPTSQDVASAARDLKSDDPKKKEDAVQQLQDAAKNAKDPQVRKEAEDALKKEGQPTTASGAETKQDGPPGQGAADGGRGKPGPKEEAGGDSKVAGKGNPNDRGGSKSPEGAADPKQTGDAKPAEGTAEAGEPKPAGPGPEGGRTKGNGKPNRGPGSGNGPGDDTPLAGPDDLDPNEGSAADLRHKARAGELQLEEFKKRVTPEMLKKFNMTKEQYDKFLKDYEARLKELKSSAQEQEKIEKALLGSGQRPNPGVTRVRPPTTGTRDPLQGVGPLLPPSEFQKSYSDFTEELSKLKPKR
ncbi:MAG: hypothetical protein K2R98_16295 [Gemmataceae bacterium]|nr:hypothetical protein [Gemmataceae bacterium]